MCHVGFKNICFSITIASTGGHKQITDVFKNLNNRKVKSYKFNNDALWLNDMSDLIFWDIFDLRLC